MLPDKKSRMELVIGIPGTKSMMQPEITGA
jgi:hypothetical protein